jgi:hypothetical protein
MTDEHGTSLAEFKPARMVIGGAPMPTPAEFEMFKDMSAWIARSRMFPALQTPESVMASLLMIRDMGVAPTLGLAEAFVIEGRVGFGTKLKLAALQSRVPTFKWETPVWDEKVCTVKARLSPNDDWKSFTYTRAEADKARYSIGKDGQVKKQWEREPKLMLLYRALTRWMNLYAPHVLFGLPVVLQEAGDPVETEYEVVEDRPRETVAAPAADGAQGRVPPPAPTPTDFREAFAKLARKMGKKSNAQFLDLLTIVFKELGLTPPTSYTAVGPSDWKRAYEALTARYDPETGRPLPKPQDGKDGASSEADEKGAGAAEPTHGEKATAPASEPEPPEGLFEETEIPDFGSEPALDLETEPATGYDPWQSAERGDGPALVHYARNVEAAYAKAGKPRRFITEKAGDTFFVYGPALVDCGSTKAVNGKQAPLAALIATANPENAEHVVSLSLRVMLAAACRQALDALEAGRS